MRLPRCPAVTIIRACQNHKPALGNANLLTCDTKLLRRLSWKVSPRTHCNRGHKSLTTMNLANPCFDPAAFWTHVASTHQTAALAGPNEALEEALATTSSTLPVPKAPRALCSTPGRRRDAPACEGTARRAPKAGTRRSPSKGGCNDLQKVENLLGG